MIWPNIGVMLGILLCGYAVGRRLGRAEGFGLGMRYSPLELRREFLLDGRCPICGSRADDNDASN